MRKQGQCSAADPDRRTPGRPVAMSPESRRERIFDALDAVFERAGLDGLTMDAVAAEAEMSKRTIYDLFDDRNALLHAYIERVRSDFIRPLSPGEHDLPLEARLRRLLSPVACHSRSGLPLALLRLAIANACAQPDLARYCLDHRVETDRNAIRDELDRAVARGEAEIGDTDAAAEMLEAMVRPAILNVLLDPDRRVCPGTMQARFELGLAMFLRGVSATQR